jgi:hypothetical protein
LGDEPAAWDRRLVDLDDKEKIGAVSSSRDVVEHEIAAAG